MDPVSIRTPLSLAELRTQTTAKITSRLDRLHELEQTVQQSSALDAQQKTRLTNELDHEIDGLTQLQQKVASDTSIDDVRADAHAMVVDYRVFAVETPKVKLTIKLAEERQKIQHLTEMERAGTPLPNGVDHRAIVAARAALQGQGEALAAVAPQDYSTTLFDAFRKAVRTANEDLAPRHHRQVGPPPQA